MSSFKQLIALFIPKQVRGLQRQKAEYLVAAIFIAGLASVIGIYMLYILKLPKGAPYSFISLLGIVAALITLRFFAQVELAVYILIACVIAALVSASVVDGGLLHAYIFWLAMVPMGVAFVLNPRQGIMAAGFCIVALTCVYAFTPSQLTALEIKRLTAYKNLAFFALAAEIVFSLALTLLYKQQKQGVVNQLTERNQAIETIVHNAQSGFLMVGKDFQVLPAYSQACLALFQVDHLHQTDIIDLFKSNPNSAKQIQSALQQIFEDRLPEASSLADIPSPVALSPTLHVSLDAKIIRDHDHAVTAVFFTINDASLLIKAEEINKKNQLLLQILRNKEGFLTMLRETKEALSKLETLYTGSQNVYSRRILHTLKGNLASFGLEKVAHIIHSIENQSILSTRETQQLRHEINQFLSETFDVLGVQSLESVQDQHFLVTHKELNQIQDMLLQYVGPDNSGYAILNEAVKRVANTSIMQSLLPLEQQLQQIARIVHKKVRLKLNGDDIKVGYHVIKICQHLPNLLRNALFHGIEDHTHRGAKPWPAVIQVYIEDRGKFVYLALEDDGRGIDLELVRQKAKTVQSYRAHQIDAMNHQQLLELVFEDGMSTETQMTEQAGHGNALASLKGDLEDIGGFVTIESQKGQGTRVEMYIPKVINLQTKRMAI